MNQTVFAPDIAELFRLSDWQKRLFLWIFIGWSAAACSPDQENRQSGSADRPAAGAATARAPEAPAGARPSFLIILADDMGYSDIGVMGGEIRTPNIDRLAARGMLLTNFRVHTMCSPTRAMLLTGADTHIAGYGTMAGEFTPEIRGRPGYETFLADRVTTIAALLRDNGYHTYISGKWDMGGHDKPALWPDKRGFEESFVLVEGSGSHFDKSPALLELAEVTYVENGRETELPDEISTRPGIMRTNGSGTLTNTGQTENLFLPICRSPRPIIHCRRRMNS